jgi:hypothetical protein
VEQTNDWPGFGRQKNRALDLARGDWVLSIDADELVTEALAGAIREAISRTDGSASARSSASATADAKAPVAWWIERRSRWCGRPVRFGDWRRDRVLRLFRRGSARFSDDIVHERVVCDGMQGQLAGWLWHDTVDTPADGTEKALRYARLGAERLRQRGRGGPKPEVRTDAGGRFLLRDVPTGSHQLEFASVGMTPVTTDVDILAADTTFVSATLRTVTNLQALNILGAGTRGRAVRRFEERRQQDRDAGAVHGRGVPARLGGRDGAVEPAEDRRHREQVGQDEHRLAKVEGGASETQAQAESPALAEFQGRDAHRDRPLHRRSPLDNAGLDRMEGFR